MLVKYIFLLLICCGGAYSISAKPDYSTADQDKVPASGKLAKFDTIEIDLHVLNTYTTHSWKSVFYPRVDEFAWLEISYTADPFFIFNENTAVWLEIVGSLNTTSKHIYSLSLDVSITYYTVIVTLSTGSITAVEWDENNCDDCKTDLCVDNLCGVAKKDIDCTQVDCNIKVYFAWQGTDSNSRSCSSVGDVPSAFKSYSATPLEKVGGSLWGDVTYKVQSVAPPPPGFGDNTY